MSDIGEKVEQKRTKSRGGKIISYIIVLIIIAFGIIWFLQQDFDAASNTNQSTATKFTQGEWSIRWYEKKRGERKHRIRITEYSATKFVFSVGTSKNKMWFTWDKAKNPEHGTWYRAGTDYKGVWKVEKVSREGKMILKGYHTWNGKTYETYIEET